MVTGDPLAFHSFFPSDLPNLRTLMPRRGLKDTAAMPNACCLSFNDAWTSHPYSG
jgi:hypothetical protein